jgi:putative membrane protein
MKKMILTAVIAAGLGFTPAIAQTPTGTAQKPKPTEQTPKGTSGSAAVAPSDVAFAKEAAIGGMEEVELGTLAKEKAASPDVKQFGDRMVTDHSKANDELKKWAQEKNVTLPTDLDAKGKARKDKLSKLSGAEFDKAYMHEMVTDHTKDVSEFKHHSTTGKDADLKAWAGQTLPTLEEHLKMAKEKNAAVSGEAKTPKQTPKK